MDNVRVSEREMKALRALHESYDSDYDCMSFKAIAARSGLPLAQVRRTVRALARKGLAQYERGLFNEDGEVYGSGYSCTIIGHQFLEPQT